MNVSRLMDLVCGRPVPEEERGPRKTLLTAAEACLVAVGVCIAWAFAVSLGNVGHALKSFYKVPAILLFSALVALPAAALTWRMSGTPGKTAELLRSFFVGVLGGALVLAVVSPIVGLYYGSSRFLGPTLAQASVLGALAVGVIVFVRALFVSRTPETQKRRYVWPVAAASVLFTLAVVQFVAMFSPILPERTVFDKGVDGLLKGH